jgi:hypothetical protein|tara:strand:+ start:4956 stop:5387 length:432 start_codon:yes stop_codon:yes gene_type:complete
MADMKVTMEYEKFLDADHVILSDELKDALFIAEDLGDIETADHSKLTITLGDSETTATVGGVLQSIASGPYLTVGFNARSNCKEILEVLQSCMMSDSEVTIDVTGNHAFQATSGCFKKWDLTVQEDRSALLTFTMGTENVIFR